MLQTLSWLPRTEGTVRLGFARRDEQTQLDDLYQAGAARVRFPRPAAGAPPEAVLLNMAGGLTGGDRMSLDVTLGARAEATLTTAAAEKIYRARDGDATIGVKLALGAGARLAWLPQATILFDGSRLDRRTEVQLAGDARFLGVEFLIFGRQAMGEDVHLGACRDAWRIRRDGALVFADTFRISGAIAAALDRRATLAAFASISTTSLVSVRFAYTLPSPAEAPYSGLPPSEMFVTSVPARGSITVEECASPFSVKTRFDAPS